MYSSSGAAGDRGCAGARDVVVVVVHFDSVDRGKVKLVRSGRAVDRCVELEGSPDLVVECVSESSIAKDQLRLSECYAAARIPEYCIVDARAEIPRITLLRKVGRRYREDPSGFVWSTTLARRIKLERVAISRYRRRHARPVRTM